MATVLRVARREAWATLYGHIERLAGLPAVTDVEYIACIREVVMYEPNEGMRALPHFLRSRPEMRMDSVAALLDRSVVSVRSPSQVVELVERGSLYWDTDVMRLRLAD